MSKINCNIIKDLLPSYLEQLCSKETKNLVEEHFAECEACRNLAKVMAETEFSSDKTDMKTIDYMKKVNRYFVHKNLLLFGMLVLFIIAGMIIIINNLYRDTAITPQFYYIAMPALLFAMHYILSGYMPKKVNQKWQLFPAVLGVIGIGYSLVLTYTCIRWIQTGQYPMEASEAGPYVANRFLGVAVIELILFLITCIISLKNNERCGIPSTIHLTGCFVNLSLIFLLTRISRPVELIYLFGNAILPFLIEGIIMAFLLYWLEKRSETVD